jgi:Mrp family chromosome partitioning ATPase
MSVTVTVSGKTGSGKSRIAFEIETALRAIGVKVEWFDPTGEGEARHEAWAEANNAWQPNLPDVMLQEINTPITIAEGFNALTK